MALRANINDPTLGRSLGQARERRGRERELCLIDFFLETLLHKFQGSVISANIQSGTLCNYIGNLSHNLEVKMLYTLFDIQMKVRANPSKVER